MDLAALNADMDLPGQFRSEAAETSSWKDRLFLNIFERSRTCRTRRDIMES